MCRDCADTLREQRDDAQRTLKEATEKAWQQGMADAAKLCIQNADLGNPEGWTDSVSRDCAKIITENITKNRGRDA